MSNKTPGSESLFLPKDSFKDTKIKVILDEYRNTVSTRYQYLDPKDIENYLAPSKYLVSRKYDGELWYLISNEESSFLVAQNGRILNGGISVLREKPSKDGLVIIAGELHLNSDGKRERVGDVSSNISQGNPEKIAKLSFTAFDLLIAPEFEWKQNSYEQRLKKLEEIDLKNLNIVDSQIANDALQISEIYKTFVEKFKAEGVIVRSSDGRAYKVKPNLFVDCYVIGYTTRQDSDNNAECRSVMLGLMTKSGEIVPVGVAGSFTDQISRKDLLGKLENLKTESQYRQSSSSGQLFTFCKPEVIVEVKALDFQTEDSKEKAIRQANLKYSDGNGYEVLSFINAGSLTNASLVRIRDDKPNDQLSVRWEQVEDFMPALLQGSAELEKSEIIQRRVWAKESADKTDVRKLVVWKTNKEAVDDSYPPFVVHWTDYSSTRKSPLNREVKPAYSMKYVGEIVEEMVSENIKKGWIEKNLNV